MKAMATKFKRKAKGEAKESFWNKKTMMSLFIVAIMVLSVLGFMAIRNSNDGYSFVYQGILFEQDQQGGLIAEINGEEVVFRYTPQQLELMNFTDNIIPAVKNTRMIYITNDPDAKYISDLALLSFELSKELPQYFRIYTVNGLTAENDYDVPIVTCLNATQNVPVIYFKDANETRAFMNGNCIFFEAKTAYDFSYLKERLMYGMFGILPNVAE